MLKLIKQESIITQKLGSHDFRRIADSVLNKSKSAVPPLVDCPRIFSSASDKAKLFSENFSKNSNFDDSYISLPAFPFGTNPKMYNISVTSELVKKVIANLGYDQGGGNPGREWTKKKKKK